MEIAELNRLGDSELVDRLVWLSKETEKESVSMEIYIEMEDAKKEVVHRLKTRKHALWVIGNKAKQES